MKLLKRLLFAVLFLPIIMLFVIVMMVVMWAEILAWMVTGKGDYDWFLDFMDWFLERSPLAKLQD